MKTLDKTEVSSIQGVPGGETFVVFLTFAMCCVVPFTVSKSKSSYEDAGQDQGKFVSGGCRGGDS